MNARSNRICGLSSVLLLMLGHLAFGAAGTDKAASKGESVTPMAGWPEGVEAVVNDPSRTEGWHHWFSECPNDVYYYAMDVKSMADVNRLVRKLAAIQSHGIQVVLDPANSAHPKDGVGARFILGNQVLMNLWYFGLKPDAMGVRHFGVQRYFDPPVAMAPTLYLYVANFVIDLKQLDIPAGVEVTASIDAVYRKNHPNDAMVMAMDAFVISHKKSAQSRPRTR